MTVGDRWTFNAQALRLALGIADVARCVDASRPILQGWRLTTEDDGKVIQAVATNSYHLAVCRVSADQPLVAGGEFGALFAEGDPKAKHLKYADLAPLAKPADASSAVTTVEVVQTADTAFTVETDGSSCTVRGLDVEQFPSYQGLMPDGPAIDPAGGAFNPAYLDAPTRALAALRKALKLKADGTNSTPVHVDNLDPLKPALLSWRYLHQRGALGALTIDTQHLLMPVRTS